METKSIHRILPKASTAWIPNEKAVHTVYDQN